MIYLLIFYISFLILSLWFIFRTLKINKLKILNNYYLNLQKYPLNDIFSLFILTKNEKNLSEEYLNNLEETINNINYIIFGQLKTEYKYLQNKINTKFYFSNRKFKQKILKIDSLQFEYKIAYAKIIFELHELNLKNEIKSILIFSISEIFRDFKTIIKNSRYKESLGNTKIYFLIKETENKILNLNLNNKTFSDFLANFKKIILDLQNLNNSYYFFLNGKDFITKNLKNFNLKFKKITDDNQIIFKKYLFFWKLKFDNLNSKIKRLKININNLNYQIGYKSITNISNDLNQIINEANLNLNSFYFIKDYEIIILNLTKKILNQKLIETNNPNFFPKATTEKFLKLNFFEKKILFEFNLYQSKKNGGWNNFSPQEMLKSLTKLYNVLFSYFSFFEEDGFKNYEKNYLLIN